MSTTPYQQYLRDLGSLICDKAREAKLLKEKSAGTEDFEFNLGRLMAFHEVVSLMKQQAEAFGLPLDELSLAELSPERDLL